VKQFVGGTGIHNPVLGTAEEHFPLPLSSVATHSPRCLNSVVDNENLTTVTTGDNGDNENQATGEMVEKVAILEQELATQKAEIEAKQRESDNARQRLEANAQANLESEIEARNRAAAARELEIRQRAATELDNARQRAEEAAATAARELAAAQALATEKEERGALTDEQIDLATAVIRTAITEGHIEKVGTPQVSPILKAAGLPTGAPVQRVLHKLACKQLEAEGLVIQNPNKANGQPLYLIA
jgi:paraquat-inducible protein B